MVMERLPTAVEEVVDVWEVRQGDVAAVKQDRPPSFRAVVLSTSADTLGLQVVGDDLPSGDQDVILRVAGRGAFELVRVERWPARPGEKRPRVLLKLRASSAT